MTSTIEALRYAGPFESSGAFALWLREWENRVTRNYYFWCIRGNGTTVLVDSGVGPRLARERALTGYANPARVIEAIGLKAQEVQHLVLTHLHWDHANGASLFPNARYYVQSKEYRFWMENPVARRPPFQYLADPSALEYLCALEGKDQLCLLDGDREILPGIRCLLAPGHTVGLQAVAVDTASGVAILASDCAHFFRNFQEDWPSALIVDLVAWMGSYEKLRNAVTDPSLVFPGHDPLLSTNYPQVAPGITRLV